MSIYNWIYYSQEEIDMAQNQIDFFLGRIEDIKKKTNMNEEQKKNKLAQINLSINSIKYTYSL
jgi:hypothetical protein